METIPRARDDPHNVNVFEKPADCFPRVRGWSHRLVGQRPTLPLLPATRGDGPGWPGKATWGALCSPHPRGDGPRDLFTAETARDCSPHPRGRPLAP